MLWKELIFISLFTCVKIRWGFNDPYVGKHNIIVATVESMIHCKYEQHKN